MHVEVSLNVSHSSTDWCNIVGEASDMKSMGGLLVWNMIRYKREAGSEAMNTDTIIAKNIRVADEKASYDAACKRLLSEKIILAWIMKNCLEEYRDCDVDEIAGKYIEGTPQVGEVAAAPDESNRSSMIQGAGNEDASLTEGTVAYDIRFLAVAPVSGELIRLIINIEAQNDFYPGYPLVKRGIYYCSRMISAQYGTEFTNSPKV